MLPYAARQRASKLVLLGVPCVAMAPGCGGDPSAAQLSTISLTGTVLDEQYLAVPDMAVCLFERPDLGCATTNQSGAYVLEVPKDEDVIIGYEKAGFIRKLRMFGARDAAYTELFFIVQTTAWGPAVGMGPSYVLSIISAQASGSEPAGVKLTLDPPSGTGPAYLGERLQPDGDLDATAASGTGAFVDVQPGRSYEVQFHAPRDVSCEAAGWAGSGPSSTVARAVAGYATHVGMTCN